MLAVALACLLGAGACTRPPSVSGRAAGRMKGAPARSREQPSPSPVRQFTIAATGDTLVHSGVAEAAAGYGQSSGRAFDFRPMFARVQPLIAGADLAACHLETPLAANQADLGYYPVFNVPHEIAGDLEDAGYDYCSTASNHALDAGAGGVESTLDALDGAGLEHAGMARSLEKSLRPAVLAAEGFEVAFFSYTYGLNGFSLPADQPWLVRSIDTSEILRDGRAARRRGADFVVVSLHWGVEYRSAPASDQLATARRLLGSRAVDLILGHHAHVIQPIARFAGKYAVLGMGNFLSNQSSECCPPETQDGVIVEVTVRERPSGRLRTARVDYTPTWVKRGPFTILPVAHELDEEGVPPEVRGDLIESWDRTVTVIESGAGRGAKIAPARVPQALSR